MELFKHQKEGIAFLKKKKRAILADEMGLGKTRQAIIAAGETGEETTLIVCPASLKMNWEREIKMIYPEDIVSILSGANPGDEGYSLFYSAAWIIINYDILAGWSEVLKKEAENGRFGAVIFDEAHYIKDTKAIRTKAALSIAEKVDQVYLLTGTPVMNRPIELFSLLRAVKHPLAYNVEKAMSTLRREYGKRYCGAYFHRLGFTGRGFWDEKGATRLPELRELTKSVFLRRLKSEVLDLPEKIVSIVPVELTPEWQKEYATAWQKYLDWVAAHPNEKEIGDVLSAQAIIELGKLKQVCSRAKIARIVSDVENAVEQGQKVIVFSQYTETIRRLDAIFDERGIRSVTLTGEDDQEARQRSVDDFQNDADTKVFIANIKAGGVGITLTAASVVMFADMEWSPEIHRQAEDRAHRIGQSGTVNVYYYIAEKTIEEDVIDILMKKQETIGMIMGGDTIIPAFTARLLDKMEASSYPQ